MNAILIALYFYLPAAVANMSASLAKYVPVFNAIKTPVDFGFKLRGIRLIGDHKVWGAALFGVLAGLVSGILRFKYFDPLFPNLTILELKFSEAFVLSFLLSFGAVSGDLIFSAIKRQLKIPPHRPFIPFDEVDHSLVSMLLVRIFFSIPLQIIAIVILTFFILHIIANILSWKLGIKNVPY